MLIKATYNRTTSHFLPDVDTYQDYFPFGMVMSERSGSESSAGYRYGFQGQEKDDELRGEGNSINYKYRMHDARIGRFFAVDPLTADYPWNSPYAFSENRMIDAIELEGLELFLIHGTWGDNGDFKPVLRNKLKSLFGNTETFDKGWNGNNNHNSRKEAAREYITLIKDNHKPGEAVIIFSHSHGGNIAIMVMIELANDPAFEGVELNLVTLNTPVIEYQFSEEVSNRVNHYQIYNVKDPVQVLGGNKVLIGEGVNFLTGEFGRAGRTFATANNIVYDSNGFLHHNHTGWKMKNVDEWFPKLENEVNGGGGETNFEMPKEKKILGSEGM